MSSPMFELPDHYPMPVNSEGDGPAEPSDTVREVCACGDSSCVSYLKAATGGRLPDLPVSSATIPMKMR